MLKIKNLSIGLKDSNITILRDINLSLDDGQICALTGPNGSGKSTLVSTIIGNPKYEILSGSMEYDGKNLINMPVHERAVNGIFLAFQNPVAIPGVTTLNFLKTSLNQIRLQQNQQPISTPDFIKLINENADALNINKDLLYRPINQNFSGGEKKMIEVLQMIILNPRLIILDELDSGMDVTTLDNIFSFIRDHKKQDASFIVISHNKHVFDYLKPNQYYYL